MKYIRSIMGAAIVATLYVCTQARANTIVTDVIRPFLMPVGVETMPSLADVKKMPGSEWAPQVAGRANAWATKSIKGRKGLFVEAEGSATAIGKLHVEQFAKAGGDAPYLSLESLGKGELKQVAMECQNSAGKSAEVHVFAAIGFRPVYVVQDESFGTREGSSWLDLFHLRADVERHCATR